MRETPDRAPTRLELPRRALVVLGGLPGAGKSTLLNRLREDLPPGELVIRDPEDIRTGWERVLGGRRFYRLWRPFVYLDHYTRLATALPGRRPIILHDTATRGWARRTFAAAARLCGRPAILLWLDVSLEESIAGQRVRGRKVPRRALRRHWQRWTRERADRRPERGYTEVRLLDRDAARTLVLEPAPGRGR